MGWGPGTSGRVRYSLQGLGRRGLLPTVMASNNVNDKHKRGLLPTPTVRGNHNKATLSATAGDGLATVVKRMQPDPRAAGPLNPVWLEVFMGFPEGHTESEP